MEFSPPWKKAQHEIKHGFMVIGKKYENRTEKQRNALRQPGFLNEGSGKNGAGAAPTPSTEHLGTLCSQGGQFCTDCCRTAAHAPIITAQEIIPVPKNASKGDTRT